MLGRCLGEQRVRQSQHTLQRGKLTRLCLFLTVIVLRGTIGAGKFSTPEQDFNEIRQRLHHHRSLPHGTIHFYCSRCHLFSLDLLIREGPCGSRRRRRGGEGRGGYRWQGWEEGEEAKEGELERGGGRDNPIIVGKK